MAFGLPPGIAAGRAPGLGARPERLEQHHVSGYHADDGHRGFYRRRWLDRWVWLYQRSRHLRPGPVFDAFSRCHSDFHGHWRGNRFHYPSHGLGIRHARDFLAFGWGHLWRWAHPLRHGQSGARSQFPGCRRQLGSDLDICDGWGPCRYDPWLQVDFAPQLSVADDRFHLPTRRQIDLPLVGGAALFGVGWGLAGICPGPALADLVTLEPKVLLFVAAMLVGMIVTRAWRDRVYAMKALRQS